MEMATIAAAVMLSQGVPVHLFSDLVPTPFVAFAVEQLGCAGGVMVTASHNPKEYNGYKVTSPSSERNASDDTITEPIQLI